MLTQKQMDQVADRFIERLKSQGYVITEDFTTEGKSGIGRTFDYFVNRTYGFLTYTVAIDVITNAEDPEVSLQKLFAFEDKCSDCSIEYRAIIAVPRLSVVAAQFAQKDGVKVFDRQMMEAFLARPPLTQQVPVDLPSRFVGKSELAEALRLLGYQVEEGAKLVGSSGTQYVFDALASLDDGFLTSRLGIDYVVGDGVDLGQVSLFDVKCSDAGIKEKALLVSGKLTAAAREFVEQHGIQVVNLDEEAESAETLAKATQSPKGFTMRSVVDQLLVSQKKPKIVDENKKSVSGREKATVPEEVLGAEPAVEETMVMEAGAIVEKPVMAQGLSKPVVEETAVEKPVAEAKAQVGPTVVSEQLRPLKPLKPVVKKRSVSPVSDVQAKKSSVVSEPPKPVVEEVVEKPKVKLRKAARPEALRLIPESTARKFTVIPLNIADNILEVAMVNPSDMMTIQILEHQSKMRVKAVAADKKEIQEAIDFNYKGFGQIAEQISRIDTGADAAGGNVDLVAATANAPVAAALNLIVEEAVKARASDIHIEPEEKRLRIRYRIDGVLHEVMSLPIKIHPSLTSRVKVMSDLNIADHLRPQDGQFSIEVKDKSIDVRVATSPTVHGETVVMRLLDKSVAVMDLPQLGFSPEALKKYEKMLEVPFGMILISGPTGSGKTTTLYASVNTLDKVTRNIITVEDPVEYRFENIKQIQVNPKAGLTFASALRSMMRLDPDIILVGEIRDAETATIAVKSALTGHLVLSSIHANDAIGVVYRLLDLGVEPFMVASVITGTVAQRMARRICLNCAAEVKASPAEQAAYHSATGEDLESFLSGSGCDLCAYSGYRGRLGLYEVLTMSDRLKAMILKGASASEVKEQAVEEGMITLLKDGMIKVKEGRTTVSEVLRNAYSME